jgi:hypothetical protein
MGAALLTRALLFWTSRCRSNYTAKKSSYLHRVLLLQMQGEFIVRCLSVTISQKMMAVLSFLSP